MAKTVQMPNWNKYLDFINSGLDLLDEINSKMLQSYEIKVK